MYFQHSRWRIEFLVHNSIQEMLYKIHHVFQDWVEFQIENLVNFEIEIKSLICTEASRNLEIKNKYIKLNTFKYNESAHVDQMLFDINVEMGQFLLRFSTRYDVWMIVLLNQIWQTINIFLLKNKIHNNRLFLTKYYCIICE